MRIEALSARMDSLERKVEENTAITQAIKTNTDEIVEFFQSGKGFFRVVRGVGTAARVVGYIAGAAGILWAVTKFGIGQLLADMGIRK